MLGQSDSFMDSKLLLLHDSTHMAPFVNKWINELTLQWEVCSQQQPGRTSIKTSWMLSAVGSCLPEEEEDRGRRREADKAQSARAASLVALLPNVLQSLDCDCTMVC